MIQPRHCAKMAAPGRAGARLESPLHGRAAAVTMTATAIGGTVATAAAIATTARQLLATNWCSGGHGGGFTQGAFPAMVAASGEWLLHNQGMQNPYHTEYSYAEGGKGARGGGGW
jgi:hypothetical protein